MKEKDFKKLQGENYSLLAKQFDKLQKRDNRNHLNKIKAISDFLRIEKKDNILEIGVGTGIHAKHLFDLNKVSFFYTGVDLSDSMLRQAKDKLKGHVNVSLKRMDGENLKFSDKTFDKVYISGSLHHFFDPKRGIFELLRVLKDNGKFCIMEPNYFFPTNFYASNTIKSERNMRLMRKENFNVWMKQANVFNYKIYNFGYTPPFPKFLSFVFNVLDIFLNKIPILKNCSIMLLVCGEK